jgi:hypothetical protein
MGSQTLHSGWAVPDPGPEKDGLAPIIEEKVDTVAAETATERLHALMQHRKITSPDLRRKLTWVGRAQLVDEFLGLNLYRHISDPVTNKPFASGETWLRSVLRHPATVLADIELLHELTGCVPEEFLEPMAKRQARNLAKYKKHNEIDFVVIDAATRLTDAEFEEFFCPDANSRGTNSEVQLGPFSVRADTAVKFKQALVASGYWPAAETGDLTKDDAAIFELASSYVHSTNGD